MSITKITTYVDNAKNRLLEQYKSSTNINNLIAAEAIEYQDLENDIFDVYIKRNIDVAEGVQLDRIGENVGAERNGLDDELYRRVIYTQIQINVSGGDAEAVLNALKYITNATRTRYKDSFPAGMELYVESVETVGNLYDKIEKIVGVGIQVKQIVQNYTNTHFVLSETFLEDSFYHVDELNADQYNVDDASADDLFVTRRRDTPNRTGLGLSERSNAGNITIFGGRLAERIKR